MMPRLLAIAGLALTLSTTAQNIHGPRLGGSLATQSAGGLFLNTSNLLPGFVLGYGVELPMHPQFIIMPELLWMTKGAVVRNPAQLTRSKTALRYLELHHGEDQYRRQAGGTVPDHRSITGLFRRRSLKGVV